MKKFAAQYIFPVTSPPLKYGIVETDNSGTITNIIDTGGKLPEIAGLEYYNGVIVPGFVNTHCHLELSHLKNKFEQKTGMHGFIKQIVEKKNSTDTETIKAAIAQGDKNMQHEGIVAVGDISNTNISFEHKINSKIDYHTFIEITGPSASTAERNFKRAKALSMEATDLGLRNSIVPHAPYTMAEKLLKMVVNYAVENNLLLSFHNQESKSENEFFVSKSGEIFQLFTKLGIPIVENAGNGKNSLQSLMHLFPQKNKILLIHNTASNEEDIDFAQNYFDNLYLTLCPNSNLCIENTLPDVDLFYRKNLKVTIGTDSLASNTKLSVLNEMKTLQLNVKNIDFAYLLKCATINGAEALNLNDKLGSLEKGKKAGINLIEHFDFEQMKLTEKSKIKVLV